MDTLLGVSKSIIGKRTEVRNNPSHYNKHRHYASPNVTTLNPIIYVTNNK